MIFRSYNKQIETIIEAAKIYATEITNNLPIYNNDKYDIEINSIKNKGLLEKKDIINPINNKEITGCIELTYNASKKKYSYHYTNECKFDPKSPRLDDNMIPVAFKNNKWGTVADETWYNYDNKEWANVVVVKDPIKYKAEPMRNNFEVLEEDILGHFVWIPRYRYELFNTNDTGWFGTVTNDTYVNEAKTINIVFENKNTTVSTGSSNG